MVPARVGAALLRGEWEAAVKLVMEQREGERPENVEGRRLYLEEGDIQVGKSPQCIAMGLGQVVFSAPQ